LKTRKALIKIHAVIFVARNSQKQIVIGKDGNTLKKIGKQARIEIEEYFNKKVFLKTWVKVKKNWNTDSDYLQSLGVGGSYD
jgi:GTP-binding protein Era